MVALLIAATAPELNLRGVTCVAGNVEIHHVARNTGKILQMVGRSDVPVSIGAARPLQRRLRTAPETHGPDRHRLRGAARRGSQAGHHRVHPDPRRPLPRGPRRAGTPGEVTVVALGPLTNLAAATLNGVDLAGGAREVVWMGGTLEERGNTTDTGEWNACVDPEAAETCLRAGALRPHLPAGRDAGRDLHHGRPAAPCPTPTWPGIVRDAVRFYVGFHRQADGIDGCYLHDPVTLIGSLLRPDLVTETVSERLACDTGGGSLPGRQPVPFRRRRIAAGGGGGRASMPTG